MKVYWATRLRGFLKHISEHTEGVQFVQKDQYYETSGKLSILKSKLIRSRLLDPIGLFQVIKVSGKDCDCYGSFNRFLESDKPYFIYLENPTALYHYALGRVHSRTGEKRFRKRLHDSNLKYVVCMSEACRSTFERVNMQIPEGVKFKTIYPLVPKNPNVDEVFLKELCRSETLECLYCVQGKRFVTKGGPDVIEAVEHLYRAGVKIHLTVITHLSALDAGMYEQIKACEFVTLHDFSYSYSELEKVYANTHLLLQPSSDDSSSLTVLEAMKGGCAVIGTKLYAFPEMVEDGQSGYLIEPKFRIFTEENLPNPRCWPRRKKLQYAKQKDETFVNNIENGILSLYNDRDKLSAFSLRSLEIANTKFGEETICQQWAEVWNTLELEGKAADET